MLVSMDAGLTLAAEGIGYQIYHEGRTRPRRRRLEVRAFDHHLTHAAAGCFTSPFNEAVCAVVDGFGERSSTAFFHYKDGRLRPVGGRERSTNSLGYFYMALCQACGFDPVAGEEWKVMGLAAYGKVNDAVYAQLRPALRVRGLRVLGARQQYTSPLWRRPPACSPADLAFTGQMVFEQCMTELLSNLRRLGLSNNLVLAGGCALNSLYNGKVLARTQFSRLHVFSAPADDGNAVGAALLAYYQDHLEASPSGSLQSPYLGAAMSPDTLQRVIAQGVMGRVRHLPGSVHCAAAQMLADGKIIGWVQGRAEFGPRALGNRSILADPRHAQVKNTLNNTVKKREPFRPFAPAIQHEYGPDYFEDYRESPYMERALRFRSAMADRVPGVVHVDGTGRLQTVKNEWNPKFHTLLAAFHERTGVPVLLNTSFNLAGKPVIHSVEDAIAMYASSGLDALVIDDYLFTKSRPVSGAG
jgi:carbamoyltransferase